MTKTYFQKIIWSWVAPSAWTVRTSTESGVTHMTPANASKAPFWRGRIPPGVRYT